MMAALALNSVQHHEPPHRRRPSVAVDYIMGDLKEESQFSSR